MAKTKFEQDMENVLGEYILGEGNQEFEGMAKKHFSDFLFEHQNFDMSKMSEERKDYFFFVEGIDKHSLENHKCMYDGYESLGNDLVGKNRKKLVDDFAAKEAKREAKDIEPESFTAERNELTKRDYLTKRLKEKFIEDHGKEKLEEFSKALSSYDESYGIVGDAKIYMGSLKSLGKTLDILYRDITSKMEGFGPPVSEYEEPLSSEDKTKPPEEEKPGYEIKDASEEIKHYVDEKKEGAKEAVDKGVEKVKKTLKEADEMLDEKKEEVKEVIDTTAEEIEGGIGYVAEKWGKIKDYVEKRKEAFKGHWKKHKNKYLAGAGGLATAGVATWLIAQAACPPKKQKEIPKAPEQKVEKVRPQVKAVYEVKPSESLLSNDIEWLWEQDRSEWDVLPAAEKSKMGDHIGKAYNIYTDVSLNGNVVSLVHEDALNKGEQVEYIGVKVGKEGKWVYLKPGSRFDIEVAPEEAEILRNGGELEYQVVGLDKGENGKHRVKVSYKNAKLNLSREEFRELLRQELMGGLGDNSSFQKGEPDVEMGAYSLLDREGFKNAFQNYVDKISDNGEDVALLDNPLADFTGSIAEMYNEGIAPWKIGRQTGMSTQDVYRSISASREFGNVIRPTRYNARLFGEIFHPNYA